MCGFIEPTPPEPTVNQLTRKNLSDIEADLLRCLSFRRQDTAFWLFASALKRCPKNPVVYDPVPYSNGPTVVS